VLGDSRRAEVVRHRTDRDDQVIVADRVPADQLAAVLVEHRRQHHPPRSAVDAFESAAEVAVAPAVAVTAVADLVEVGVERAGGDFVQQRLPDVGAVLLDQDDVVALAAEPRAEAADQLEPAGPAADHYDLRLARGHSGRNKARSIDSPTAFSPAGLPCRWSPM